MARSLVLKVLLIVCLLLVAILMIGYTGLANASENEKITPAETTEIKGAPEISQTKEMREPAVTTIRLLTFNIHHGADANDTFDPDATIATIRNSGANIIALQEVDRVWGSRSQYYDEAQYIADQLGMNYVYGATLDSAPAEPGVGEYGIMILSKFAIIANEFYMLPGQLEQRGILFCTLQTPLGNLQVGCTHLGVTVEERVKQITALLDWLPQQDNLVVMGDFNITPDAPELQPWRTRFRDLQEQSDLSSVGTILYQNEWKRIDYIYTGSKWTPVNCQVLSDAVSDHRPVYLEVFLANPFE